MAIVRHGYSNGRAERRAQYDSSGHRNLRRLVQANMHAGVTYVCARCRNQIYPWTAWDLDHDDNDRSRYIGPSHASCNRARK